MSVEPRVLARYDPTTPRNIAFRLSPGPGRSVFWTSCEYLREVSE